jgi:hypothetical protein
MASRFTRSTSRASVFGARASWRRQQRGAPAPRFAQVATLRVAAATRYRVRLANGILVEWEGGAEASELEAVLRAAGSLG